ncbi:MAG: ferrochelatase [Bacteroidota bacterium]
MKQAVLIVNLGSPDSPETKDVRPYLNEFLMDERVIDVPLLLRKLLVQGIILNTRPKKSAKAYKKIWWEEGSPLIVLSYRFFELLKKELPIPVELGMRYGNPSIESGIQKLQDVNPDLEEIFLVPLYPHYAMSSFETVVVKTEEVINKKYPGLKVQTLAPFYDDVDYIEVLSESMRPYLEEEYDHLLFSYHGIPERHLRKGDPSKSHCMSRKDCCELANAAHHTCYRHQVFQTTHLVAEKLGIPKEKYSVSFQSRLAGEPWLTPYTDKVLEELPAEGKKKLLVVTPAFVSDCLETLEEIGMEGKEEYLEAGGESFTLIPCLNDNEAWARVVAKWCKEHFRLEEFAHS